MGDVLAGQLSILGYGTPQAHPPHQRTPRYAHRHRPEGWVPLGYASQALGVSRQTVLQTSCSRGPAPQRRLAKVAVHGAVVLSGLAAQEAAFAAERAFLGTDLRWFGLQSQFEATKDKQEGRQLVQPRGHLGVGGAATGVSALLYILTAIAESAVPARYSLREAS